MRIPIRPVVLSGFCLWLAGQAVVARAAPPGGNDECRLEFPDLQVLLDQIPAIAIPGVSPTDILAVSVVGLPVAVSSESSKILITHATGCEGDSDEPLPSHAWRLDAPAGSQSVLSPSSGLAPRFTPDVAGSYTVHFTACPAPAGCRVNVFGGFTPQGKPIRKNVTLPPTEKTLTIAVSKGAQIPPLFRPVEHPVAGGLTGTDPLHYDLARSFCSSHFGLVLGDPEWYTTATWTGSTPPYELVEGRIYKSIIAGADFPFNHLNNDVNALFDLDPPFRRLLIDDHPEDKGTLLPFGGIELEWEHGEYPEEFRPSAGDRVSALGFHVIDCGHDIYTEIHPPIAVAVHRPSAIELPAAVAFDQADPSPRPVGDNVFVPGVLTDVFVSLRGGETLGDVGRGLHQPRTIEIDTGGGKKTLVPVKVNAPTTAGVEFTFRVFLPPNPAVVLQQYGLTPSFKPAVYWRESSHPAAAKYATRSGFSLRLVEQQLDGPAPFLRFSMDLSPLAPGDRVARRIETAWVYPDVAGANWGLEDVAVRIDNLRVTDTGDFTSGDWRLWASVSGSSSPWTKLIDCHGCVEEKTYLPESSVWERGALASDGTLPGTLMRFKSSPADYLQFTGYDQDALASDGIPTLPIFLFDNPQAGSAATGCPDCPSFTVHYSFAIQPHGGTLRPEAADYFGRLTTHPMVAQLAGVQAQSALLSSDLRSAERARILLRQQDEADSAAMKAVQPANLPATVQASGAEPYARQLRERLLSQYGGVPTDAASRAKLAWRLTQLKAAFPPAVYLKYLCDLETGKPCTP